MYSERQRHSWYPRGGGMVRANDMYRDVLYILSPPFGPLLPYVTYPIPVLNMQYFHNHSTSTHEQEWLYCLQHVDDLNVTWHRPLHQHYSRARKTAVSTSQTHFVKLLSFFQNVPDYEDIDGDLGFHSPLNVGRDSSVGVVTRYELDCPRIEYR